MDLSPRELLVLDIIGDGEWYGLDIVKASDDQLSHGTIYILLMHMESYELLSSREQTPEEEAVTGFVGLRLYRSSPSGRHEKARHAFQSGG